MDSLKSSIKEMIIKILQIPEVLKSWFFLRKVGEIGQDCKIMGPAKIIGGEYITIGLKLGNDIRGRDLPHKFGLGMMLRLIQPVI